MLQSCEVLDAQTLCSRALHYAESAGANQETLGAWLQSRERR